MTLYEPGTIAKLEVAIGLWAEEIDDPKIAASLDKALMALIDFDATELEADESLFCQRLEDSIRLCVEKRDKQWSHEAAIGER